MTTSADVTGIIDGKPVTRAEVQRWEAQRAAAVLKTMHARLGARAFAELLRGRTLMSLLSASLDEQRAALLSLKTGVGHAGIYAMLRPELAGADRTARLAVAARRGRSAFSITRLAAPGVRPGNSRRGSTT